MSITFFVPGQPQGKGRARVGRSSDGHVRMRTPAKTVAYEDLVADSARYATSFRLIVWEGPVSVRIEARFKVPASWSKKKREAALSEMSPVTTKPDADNVAKVVCDALNGVMWRDDAQVCALTVTKAYSATPRPSRDRMSDDEDDGIGRAIFWMWLGFALATILLRVFTLEGAKDDENERT